MAKNSIRDYSATNSSNTDIQSIDISEGCSPAGINNAIREVMADLKDVSTGAVALESPAFDSASLTGDLTFGDNDKAIFGAGSDLQIYHDGTNSRIEDVNGANLILRSSADVRIDKYTGENMGVFNADGSVDLYYDNAKKLATTATGVDVTGTVTADGLTVDGDLEISSASPEIYLMESDTTDVNTRIRTSVGDFRIESINDAKSSIVLRQLIDHATGDISFYEDTGTTAKFFWDASAEMLGIGTVTPNRKLTVQDSVGTVAHFDSTNASGSGGGISLADANTTSNYVRVRAVGDDIQFTSGNSEAARLDASGNFLVGQTATSGVNARGGVMVEPEKDDGAARITFDRVATSASSIAILFRDAGLSKGSISYTNTSTTYSTSSDYRLKENVVADWDATTRLKQLNPVRFNFISDADTTVDGFLAHEVQDVVPEAISGTKDAMMDEEYEVSAATGDIYTPAIEAVLDEDGNEVTPAVAEVIHSTDVERPEALAEGQQWRETTAAVMGTRSVPDYQGIDQSKLVPLLVKTIQELEARITALEAN